MILRQQYLECLSLNGGGGDGKLTLSPFLATKNKGTVDKQIDLDTDTLVAMLKKIKLYSVKEVYICLRIYQRMNY